MDSLEYKLNQAKLNYKDYKEKYNDVIKSIKEEINIPYYYKDKKSTFRHVICLFFGEYIEEYSMRDLPKNMTLSINQYWSKEKKTFINNVYCDLWKESYEFSMKPTKKCCGFICEKKDLIIALKHKLKKLWLYYIEQHSNYTKSLESFKKDIKKDIDLFNLYRDYLNKSHKKYVLEVTHKPSLGINNIILYIDDTI